MRSAVLLGETWNYNAKIWDILRYMLNLRLSKEYTQTAYSSGCKKCWFSISLLYSKRDVEGTEDLPWYLKKILILPANNLKLVLKQGRI